MSSPEGSPARAPALQANAKASDTPRPFCGERWPESFASFDPATCSWRTSRPSLLSTTEPCGEKWSGTWPRSGCVSNGIAYRQQPSAPLTAVTGSSALLAVPTKRREPLSPQYAAGLIDGEGCISTHRSRQRRAIGIRLAIHMAEPGLPALEAMHRTYGGMLKPNRPETAEWRATWQWVLTSRDDVMRCLSDTAPYLIVKTPQAALAMGWIEFLTTQTRKKRNGNVDWTPETVAVGERVVVEMARLNLRGPANPTSPDGSLLTLLPTPRARVDKEHGPNGQHWAELSPTVMALLPTPMARTQSGTQVSGESRTGGPMLELGRAITLLPTPCSRDWKGEGYEGQLPTEVLPLSGASTSPPSAAGKPSTGLRLSPWFVEWMIGAPQGWSDPGCPLSATEFKSRSAGSPASTSPTSNGGG